MKAWYFSETAYPYLPDASEYESIRVTLPNRHYDPRRGAELWDRYLEEWQIADSLGLNVMINEHHATATCVDPAAPVIAGVLARETKDARILILGNPIANRPDPVRVAEEMALVDVLSRGRLEVGFVRGVPHELLPANSRPTEMHERLWEAHDLIKKAWTTHDGPFSWQGEAFEYRQVNIWPRPYQQPHPPIWVTTLSPGSAKVVAQHEYVAASFLSGYDGTKAIWDSYRQEAERLGRGAPPSDRFAYAALVYVGNTDAEGLAGAEKLRWYLYANKFGVHISHPPGYVPPAGRAPILSGKSSPTALYEMTQEQLLETGLMFAGNPDTVHRQIMEFSDRVGGMGHLLIMGQAGFLEHEETVASMSLFANEVYPGLRDV
jgi:alkanesulfonate monooxygenase SsuD/methylene tetrahydromethanopterin reductase-like flavin-dependent oxidoreductase (luciferase family)